MTGFDYDFVSLCWTLFQILVLGVLPVTAVIIFAIYLKRILVALGEKRLILGEIGRRHTRSLKRS